MPRTVRNLHRAQRDDIADLLTRRPLPSRSIDDWIRSCSSTTTGRRPTRRTTTGLPFGPHPHRGFETVTFILEGDLLHRDSGGHESVIAAGGVQWMTAGRGLDPRRDSRPRFKRRGGPLEMLQLWINLPARLKMTAPRYFGVQSGRMPRLSLEGGGGEPDLRRACGPERSGGVAHRRLDDHGRAASPKRRCGCPRRGGATVFLYVARGALQGIPAFHLVELNDDGDEVELRSPEGAALLFGHAAPIGEPVVAQGPFVMNTREEIVQAIRDYHAGLFGPLAG